MRRRKLKHLFRVLLCAVCLFIIVFVPVYGAATSKSATADDDGDLTVLNVWQIDNFEGGKGSRGAYLQKVGNEFSKDNDCYIVVTALTADAAKLNLGMGNVPDLISYGAGICGIESYLGGEKTVWCYGGYCFLTTDDSADFSDISVENTVINGGTGNLATVAAVFSGVGGAQVQKPTEGYVNLINKKFKYLLGTQRDIYRLKTRGENFKIKPIDAFNDLYQNIAIITDNKKAKAFAQKYIAEVLAGADEIKSLGLMVEGRSIHDDEVKALEGISYTYTLRGALDESKKREIEIAAQNCDENKLKILLN